MVHRSAAVVLTLALAVVTGLEPATAQIDPTYQNRKENDIFGNGSETGSSPILDATNPMDLINRLRQSEAMRDATPPSDAIDAALMDFQQGAR